MRRPTFTSPSHPTNPLKTKPLKYEAYRPHLVAVHCSPTTPYSILIDDSMASNTNHQAVAVAADDNSQLDLDVVS